MRGRCGWAAQMVDDADHRFVPCEKRRIGYVPQEGALFPHLSVGRNVAFGLGRDPGDGRPRPGAARIGRSGWGSCSSWSGWRAWHRRYPHQLSGGQQQRVALARALATEPEIVLLDEPFSSLDASLRASVRADVHDVLRKAGTTSVLVTHDQDEALSMADQVAVLRGGVIAQIDSPTRLYGQPQRCRAGPVPGRGQLIAGTMTGQGGGYPLGRLGNEHGGTVGSRRPDPWWSTPGQPAPGLGSWSAPSSW